VNQEWVAQIGGAGIAGRQHLLTMSGLLEAVRRQLAECQAVVSRGRENPSDVEVRADANTRRSVELADIREQEPST
jgi:hypothetical protein